MTVHSCATGAMLLLFDIEAGAIAEHDHWHTHEHMPERLSIPGFLRGTRWIAQGPGPRYCVLYEVADPAVLDSPAYRERLDDPTPWTSAMMKHYVGMRRALCAIAAASGRGMGNTALVIRFAPRAEREQPLRRWLVDGVMPNLAQRPGLASCHLFRNTLLPQMTREQALRGRDGAVDSALLVTGYEDETVAALATNELAPERFAEYLAAPSEYACTLFRQSYALTAADACCAANARRGIVRPTP